MWWSLGLTGYPLGHSISPLLHQAALQASGLAGEYKLYPIPPDDRVLIDLQDLCKQIRDHRIDGMNVTIPHKRLIIACMEALSQTAIATGAVNTVYLKDGVLYGDNTDVEGFLRDLDNLMNSRGILAGIGMKTKRHALVLGAGGSARAITYGLSENGWQVSLAVRRMEQGIQLVDEMVENIKPHPTFPMNVLLLKNENLSKWVMDRTGDICLLINTTPIGMWPHSDESPWIEGDPFPQFTFVYDLIYNPVKTKLIRQAESQQVKGVTGLGMLIEQARLAFERWTGLNVPGYVFWDAVKKGRYGHDE